MSSLEETSAEERKKRMIIRVRSLSIEGMHLHVYIHKMNEKKKS